MLLFKRRKLLWRKSEKICEEDLYAKEKYKDHQIKDTCTPIQIRWADVNLLREKEAKLMKDQLDGLELYVAGKASVNDTFDRYMSTKYNLRESTRSSYFYTYDHYVRDTFGNKRIAEIKYSDVLQFYYYLLNEVKISLGTLDTVHCLLHPTFQLAVRDEIIRNNPTDGVMKEISRESGKNRGIRHALTVEQQRAFMEYIANHPIYYHW